MREINKQHTFGGRNTDLQKVGTGNHNNTLEEQESMTEEELISRKQNVAELDGIMEKMGVL